MLIDQIKEIKKYFPVMKVINPTFGTGKDVVVYRGKKNLILKISNEGIYLNEIRINIKELSKDFLYVVDSIEMFKERKERLNRVLGEWIKDVVGVQEDK